MLFTVMECGLTPVTAKDIKDSSQSRIEKIFEMIEECQYSIHDISKVELNDEGLPRFNMPLELGICLGAKRYGAEKQKRKKALIVDSEKYRYLKFISDISGQDIEIHKNDPNQFIKVIRDWINTQISSAIPGAKKIQNQYEKFNKLKPQFMSDLKLELSDITHTDFLEMLSMWQYIKR